MVGGEPLYDVPMDSETQRLINLLKVSLRILGISNREVARRLGMSPSYLSKLLSGSSELRLDHLVRICRAIDMEPAEFFSLAYPRPSRSNTVTSTKLRELLQSLPSLPPPPPRHEEELSEEEIERRLKATLERLLSRGNGT